MAKKQGRHRVRLRESHPNTMEAMHKARKEAHKKAPRLENGRVIQGHKYKSLLDGHLEAGRSPTVVTGNLKAGKARPPAFVVQPSLGNRIVKLIRKGYPFTTVCRAVGIYPKTFKDWLQKGKDGYSKEYTRFYRRIAKAEAKAEMKTLETLKGHAKADWRVSAWELERRWPEHWAKKDRILAETQVSATITIDSKESLGETITKDEMARELARKMIDRDSYDYGLLNAPEDA